MPITTQNFAPATNKVFYKKKKRKNKKHKTYPKDVIASQMPQK